MPLLVGYMLKTVSTLGATVVRSVATVARDLLAPALESLESVSDNTDAALLSSVCCARCHR